MPQMGLVQKADNNTEGKRRSGFFAGGVNPCIGTLASFFSLAFFYTHRIRGNPPKITKSSV